MKNGNDLENIPKKSHSPYRETLSRARKETLDLIETTYGHTPQWKFVRSKILKIFGRDGLEKLINGSGFENENV